MGQNSSTAKRKTHSNYHKCTSCCPRWHSLLLGLVGNQFLTQGRIFLNFFPHNKIIMLYLLGLPLSNIKICLMIWTITVWQIWKNPSMSQLRSWIIEAMLPILQKKQNSNINNSHLKNHKKSQALVQDLRTMTIAIMNFFLMLIS